MKPNPVGKSGKSEGKRIGRPPEPVPQNIAEALLDWLYEGKSLLSFCQQQGMPSNRTISDWKAKDPEFAAAFARARSDGAALLVDLAQHVADDGQNDTYTDDEGHEKVNSDVVQRSKLRVDTLLKRAACFCPAEFGTKAHLEHSGGVSVQVVTGVPEDSAE